MAFVPSCGMTLHETLDEPEFFGTPEQQAMAQRAWSLWALLKDDPRYSSYGRGVALAAAAADNIPAQIALARITGAGACEHIPGRDLPGRRAALEAAGLATDGYVSWTNTPATFDRARQRLTARPLPADLSLVVVDADTPAAVLAQIDAVTQACEVFLPNGAYMRGRMGPAICVAALDGAGRAVGAAASADPFHPASDHSGTCWWGMLSTHPERRGEGIASYLGAMALIEMQDRFGMRRFFTGIRQDNAASEALCTGFGFAAQDEHILVAIDPRHFAGGRVSK